MLEVFGLDTLVYTKILPQLKIDTNKIIKIPINKVSYEELRQHPYIGSKLARVLHNYKLQNGPINNLEDMKKVLIFDAATLARLSPYLNFE
ncbi:MAG: hypothetical protein EOO99_02035 [Pedobacter sp.]|nr:MAG: hypothetical protein EOO99_02035 [Pedobacter sp.]